MNKEISAEILLNYLYPERMEQWTATNRGTFYRNYNHDAMEVDLQQNNVQLARDGLLRLLPEGIFHNQRSKEEESEEQTKWRMMLLREAFVPVDSFHFRTQLQLENEVSNLLLEEWDFVREEVLGYTVTDTSYPEVAHLLPLIRNYKGNLPFIQTLLSTLCKCPVTMDRSHRYSRSDSTVRWLPMVCFELQIPNLTAEEYRALNQKLNPMVLFIQEWLVPFDVKCEIVIRHHGKKQVPGEDLILDYNTEL